MKKIINICFLLISLCSFSQNIDDILYLRTQKTDSLNIELQRKNIQDKDILYLQNARKELKIVINKIISLENFNNKPLQKALIDSLYDYYDAFNFENEGKISNVLKYGFEKKDDFIYSYKINEALLLSKIIKKQHESIIKYLNKEVETINNNINKNLKRLGMSRTQYENLNENDQKILETQFE